MPRVLKTTSVQTPASVSNKTLPLVVVLSTLLFGALCAAGYFYYQYQQSPRVADAKEIAELKDTVGSFFMLPEGEEPTLATVTDREKLADQPFFQKAENGDKVLIYSTSGRAILYRPATQKIVDVTTVNVAQPTTDDQQPTAIDQPPIPEVAKTLTTPAVLGETTTIPAETPVTVALYNGSGTPGLTSAVEAKLGAAFPRAAITGKETARKSDYTGTVVVDVTGKASVAQAIATLLGGTVGPKPEGEPDSGTDILIIVGGDQAT